MRPRPPSSDVVPRPPGRRRRAQTLALNHALVACDLNPRYVELWPLAQRAWREVARLEPVLVLVGARADVPQWLRTDPRVLVFEPVPALHTAFQAQCIRLLYPALLDSGGGGVVVADVDMVPLSARYFARGAAGARADQFVAYRDVLLDLGEIPICYNAARPATWGDVFGVDSLDDVRARLDEWGRTFAYAGRHGGEGWTTDQRILHRTLLDRGASRRDVWILDDDYTGFRRLERTYVEKWGELSPAARDGLSRGRYTDFHCIAPDSPHAGLNEEVVDLALRAR